jgi:hypothetical protein
MITLCLSLFTAILIAGRREAAEILTAVAVLIIRRKNGWLDRSLPARRQPGYRMALR